MLKNIGYFLLSFIKNNLLFTQYICKSPTMDNPIESSLFLKYFFEFLLS